jgi:hypothetical protein
LPDGILAPLFTDLSKLTSVLEGFANATEKYLAATGQANPDQFIRKINLTVYGNTSLRGLTGNIEPGLVASPTGEGAQDGLELSALRCTFQLTKQTLATPNLLYAKVYNLSKQTRERVKQYGRVQLSAGYQKGNFGMLFDGTVVLYVQGKEDAVNTYLEIFAGDGDMALSSAVVSLTFPADSTPEAKGKAVLQQANIPVGTMNMGGATTGSPRSSSFIGPVSKIMRNLTNATKSDFFIENGTAHVIPWKGYREGEMVVLSPTSGMVGMPKVTPDGIEATCLLNPKLRLAGLVQINSDLISNVAFQPGGQNPYANANTYAPPAYTPGGSSLPAFSTVNTPTGIYKIVFLSFFGDNRGNAWYANLIGVAAGTDGKLLQNVQTTALERMSPGIAQEFSTQQAKQDFPGPPARRR